MKKLIAPVLALGLATSMFAYSASATPKIHKSYVCKYVGTPGVDETLQTGQNPIWVDNHALLGSDGETYVGQEFKDAQGRSVVIVANTPKLNPEPGIDACTGPTEEPSEEPSETPSEEPSETPSEEPSETPSETPTVPTEEPTPETPVAEPTESVSIPPKDDTKPKPPVAQPKPERPTVTPHQKRRHHPVAVPTSVAAGL